MKCFRYIPSVASLNLLSAVGSVITFLSTETGVFASLNLCKMAKIKIHADYLFPKWQNKHCSVNGCPDVVSSLLSKINTTIKLKFSQTLVLLTRFHHFLSGLLIWKFVSTARQFPLVDDFRHSQQHVDIVRRNEMFMSQFCSSFGKRACIAL